METPKLETKIEGNRSHRNGALGFDEVDLAIRFEDGWRLEVLDCASVSISGSAARRNCSIEAQRAARLASIGIHEIHEVRP